MGIYLDGRRANGPFDIGRATLRMASVSCELRPDTRCFHKLHPNPHFHFEVGRNHRMIEPTPVFMRL